MDMFWFLAGVEEQLPELLEDERGWTGVDVDYHPPRVERLWRQLGDIRVYLHRIHYCDPGEALFHPHPWPSAMKVLKGQYKMAVGYGGGDTPPPVAARLLLGPGSEYEMTNQDAWHYVRPTEEGGTVLTLMVTGLPWKLKRWVPKSEAPLKPLSDVARSYMFTEFRFHYPRNGS
ncbi:MAG: hypothetical protein AAB787_02120 [Patescibacteria group bacterium]